MIEVLQWLFEKSLVVIDDVLQALPSRNCENERTWKLGFGYDAEVIEIGGDGVWKMCRGALSTALSYT